MLPFRVPAAYFLALSFLGFAHWLRDSFGSPTIDQILYHLHYTSTFGFSFSRDFLVTFAAECLVFPLVLAVGATSLQALLQRVLASRRPSPRQRMADSIPSAFALCCALALVTWQLSLVSWVGYKLGPDDFAKEYVDPAHVPLRPAVRPKNLLLVYVESLEDSYGDADVWGRDLLAPMRDAGGVSFPNYHTTPGSSWTIAAIVATQCGVPLRFVQTDMRQPDPDMRVFLPGATCLGDILHRFGYRNVFMGGAPLSFSGKRQFLQDHHFDAIYGRTEWRKQGITPDHFDEWGLYDDELLQQARRKLVELHDAKQPFNLTVLTLDTHNPNGYRSPTCLARGAKSFEDIVECTSGQVAEFVKFAADRGYLKDTQVIVIGDHLAKANPVIDVLQQMPARRIFNRFISEGMPLRNTDEIMPFDLLPSMLLLLGIEVPGDRLGLGYTAFGPQAIPRPASRKAGLGFPSLSGSKAYERLWDQPAPAPDPAPKKIG